jgi:anti-sigma factor RsiW
MQPASHIDDDALSAFVDRQLSPDESAQVVAHVESCSECQERLDGFRSVATLLRRLPEVDPPRDFTLGPRRVVDPPNVVRLRRWYTASRVAAAALAAAFVFLSAGTLYVDLRPGASTEVQVAKPQVLSAPAAPAQNAAPTGAPRAAGAVAQAPAVAAAPRSAPINPQADDQVAAATSVRALPTPIPTPVPTIPPVPVTALAASSSPDPGGPLLEGAVTVGILAIVALLIAFVTRRRLQRASHP